MPRQHAAAEERGDEVATAGRPVRAKPGIISVLLPVGIGLEVSRFEPD